MNRSLRRLTPFHHHSGNPLFELETRRAAWHDAPTLVQRTVVWTLGINLAVFCIFLLLSSRRDLYTSFAQFYFVFSLGVVALWLDMACLRTSIRAINSEIQSGRWDLLRLTPIQIQTILRAKHAAAQVRVWRTLAAAIGVRVALLPMIAVWVGIDLPTMRTTPFSAEYLSGVAYMFAFILLLILELFWRMKAMTALGIAVSAQAREPAGAWLLGLATVFFVWLGQVAVLVGIVLGWGMFSFMFALGASWVSALCLIPMGLAILTLATYDYYLIVRTWALRRAGRRLATMER